jgi:hypothetical protein
VSSAIEEIHEYIEYLKGRSEHGPVMAIRITNKRSIPLSFQIEPTGDMAEPLQPDAAYVVVAQGHVDDYGTLDICIHDGEVSVWVEGREGQAFHNGVAVAY